METSIRIRIILILLADNFYGYSAFIYINDKQKTANFKEQIFVFAYFF